FEDVVKKVSVLRNRILRYFRNMYGISFEKRVAIVKTVIRVILAYGCEVWFEEKMLNQKTVLKRLESMQHQCLRKAVSGYRTISRCSCEVLTRTPFIGLYFLQRKRVYDLMRQPPAAGSTLDLHNMSEAR